MLVLFYHYWGITFKENLYSQIIIQQKSTSGSRTLPCLVIFFQGLILIWKYQKWSLNRGTLVSATAIYQTKCPFTVLRALFCSSGHCPMILDYSLILELMSIEIILFVDWVGSRQPWQVSIEHIYFTRRRYTLNLFSCFSDLCGTKLQRDLPKADTIGAKKLSAL